MNKNDLIKFAKENGIEVKDNLTKVQLAEAILNSDADISANGMDAELEKILSSEKSTKTTPVKLLRDYWDEDGKRHNKGSVVPVDVETAKTLIKEEKAERADPLPGE